VQLLGSGDWLVIADMVVVAAHGLKCKTVRVGKLCIYGSVDWLAIAADMVAALGLRCKQVRVA